MLLLMVRPGTFGSASTPSLPVVKMVLLAMTLPLTLEV